MHRFAGLLLLAACTANGTGEPAAPAAPAEQERFASKPMSDAAAATSVPTSPDALKAWLLAGSYKSWTKESKPHPSTGPHAASVLTYVDPSLEQSLAAQKEEHPAGSAAVKEFFGSGGEISGWAVAVKTAASSDDGKAWYWYETFSAAPGTHGIEGQGESLCVSCHLSGRDFFLSPYPLQ